MTTTALVQDAKKPLRTPSAPRTVAPLAVLGVVAAVVGIGLMLLAGNALRAYNDGGPISTAVMVVLVVVSLWPLLLAARALPSVRERDRLLQDSQLVAARRVAAGGRDQAQLAIGYALAVVIAAVLLLFVMANSGAVASTFFSLDPIKASFVDTIKAFWTNIWIAVVAQVFVLIFGLLIAVMRMLPGPAWAPLRLIATVYTDVFRGIPAIVLIMLVGFGLPLAFEFTADWNTAWLGIIAITLNMSAYMAEIYRAGLSSIHPSQSAAARSLGLSYTQTLRKVLVPQAVRRIIPPSLNNFVLLQKETALLAVVNVAEILMAARLYQANLFNLSPIVLAAGAFVLLIIPQARFVDYLIKRDARLRGQG